MAAVVALAVVGCGADRVVDASGDAGGSPSAVAAAPAAQQASRNSARTVVERARALAAAHEEMAAVLAAGTSKFVAADGGFRAVSSDAGGQGWVRMGKRPSARLALAADQPFWVAPGDDEDQRVTLRWAGAQPSAATNVDGALVYRDVYPSTDALIAADGLRIEVFYVLDDAAAPTQWRWEIDESAGLTPRPEGDEIVFVDPAGEARLALRTRAGAVDADGTRHSVTIRLAGNGVEFALEPAAGSELHYPVLVDPQWVTLAEAVCCDALLDVWGSSSNNVFFVGEGGTIRRWNGSTIAQMTSGTTVNLYGVWGSSANDVFAVGQSGTIRHWNGASWSGMTSGITTSLDAVWGTASNNVYAVGQSGKVLHYNGATWSGMTSPTIYTLNAVWGTASNNIYAAGAGQSIIHFDGSSWTTMTPPSDVSGTYYFTGIWGTSSNNLYLTGRFSGSGTKIHRWNGSTWSVQTLPASIDLLKGIWGSSASDIFAVGRGITHWDGGSWSEMTTWGNYGLEGVWGTGPSDVFAVGGTGTVLHYDTYCATSCSAPCQLCTWPTPSCTNAAAGTYSPLCSPYVCSGSSSSCPSSCTSDANCYTGAYCAPNGTCVLRKALGALCDPLTDCIDPSNCRVCNYRAAGCIDGMCCDALCDGACDECRAAKGASANGTCTVVTGAPGDPTCAPYYCATTASCPTTCSTDSDCVPGYYCASDAQCRPQKTQGEACATACMVAGCRVCDTGYCIDGVCCDGTCDQACESCLTAETGAAEGYCSPVTAGSPGLPACDPYACDGASNTCPTSCTTDAQCPPGQFCAPDLTCNPQKLQGAQCNDAAGGDCNATGCRVCSTGNCVDGYCCDTACSGLCESCDALETGASQNGLCNPVAAGIDPGSECATDAVSTCGQNGSCDGAGACQLYASGTVCQLQSCADAATQNEADTCDGSGVCVDGGTTSCSPNACSAGGCVSGNCASDGDCAAGYYCASDSQCRAQKVQGAMCDTSGDCRVAGCRVCATDNCVDGYCCDTACAGNCDACSVKAGAGSDGTCALVSGVAGNPSCTPLLCNGTSAGCPTNCLADADCASNYYCAADQTCKPQKSQGALCNDAVGADCNVGGCRVCQTGYCVDGYCCESACDGLCEACSASKTGAGANGSCALVAVGTDPDDECAAELVSTCGQNGSCDGAGACQLFASGTVCEAQACTDATTQSNADTCDGAGTCVDGGVTSCSPNACNAGGCVAGNCASDGDCAAGYYCASDGQCRTQKPQGSACDDTADCQIAGCRVCTSGNCVDSVCCDAVCGGSCEACSVAAGANTDGTCIVLSPGAVGNPSCSPFVCTGSSTGCPTQCVSDSDCGSGYYCAADQACKPQKLQGALCNDAVGADCNAAGCRVCATGNCVDGYCCDTACDGPCEACSASKTGAGSNGTCGFVAAGTDPDDECVFDDVSTCARNGSCDGAGSCQLYAAGTVCTPVSCADSTTQNDADTCDGSGTCVDGGTTSCSPYACTGGACVGGSCGADSDCQSGYYCGADSQCHAQKAQGSACDTTSDCSTAGCAVCASGNCVDGFCCDTACDGSCDVCSVAAGSSTDGTCAVLSTGSAGSPSCTPYACDGSSSACPSMCVSDAGCAATHYCASDQTCKPRKIQGSLCDPGAGADCFNAGCNVCQTGFCADGFCCGSACDAPCQTCSSAEKGSGVNGECGNVSDGTDPGADCSPYVCQAGACSTGCVTDADCASGQACVIATGECTRPSPAGTACSYQQECTSGFCVDGYCCDGGCTGQCEACDVAGSEGSCVAVQGEPHGARNACAGDPAECGGSCNGSNRAACTYPSSGTACGTSTCTGATITRHECDGQGACSARPDQSCDNSFTCGSDGTCRTTCSDDTHCISGFSCSSNGECTPAKGQCLDGHTFEGGDGTVSDCDPYVCTAGACKTTCDTSSDCLSGHVCDTGSKSCVPTTGGATSEDEGGCGCRVPWSGTRAPSPWWLLGIGALLSRRRRRARGVASLPG